MSETLSTTTAEGRKGDGYLIVVQDNASRQLTIDSLNDSAIEQLGYTLDELKGRKLEVILGQRTALAVEEDLEYDDDAPDMGDVLAKHRELRLRKRSGEEISVPITINRVMAEDKNARFQLIIPNEREGRARQQLKDFLKTSLDGHRQIDEATGLPNRATAEAYLRSISHYIAESETDAAFAVLRLDRYEKSIARYGAQHTNQLIQHVGNCCSSTFRSDDMVCSLGGPYLGLMLVDISRESVRVVLNRLRWNIRTHTIDFGGKADFSTTVSIAFDMLNRDNSGQLLAQGEQSIAALETDARNTLIELSN